MPQQTVWKVRTKSFKPALVLTAIIRKESRSEAVKEACYKHRGVVDGNAAYPLHVEQVVIESGYSYRSSGTWTSRAPVASVSQAGSTTKKVVPAMQQLTLDPPKPNGTFICMDSRCNVALGVCDVGHVDPKYHCPWVSRRTPLGDIVQNY